MVALSALPALWGQFDARQLAESLVQVLQKTLHLPLIYVRLKRLATDDIEEVASTRRPCSSAEAAEIGRSLGDVLAHESTEVFAVPDPAGGGTLRCLRVPIAWRGGRWLMLAAGSDPTFPTVEQRILLNAAANHAAVALERSSAFRSLQASELRAESANREKDELLANVSHELRTPMNAILGLTDLLLDTRLDEQQSEWLGAVKSTGHHLLGVLNTLLDFSKAGANKLTLEMTELSLREELAEMMRAPAAGAQKKALQLAVAIQDDVPDRLLGDAGRLRQILLNLLENAIKFTIAGEVTLGVSLAGEPREDEEVDLRFVVRDTGSGIPAHLHRLIFEPFAQADSSTTRRYGGTGLGLTIAAKLAALMNGEITLRSEPDVGSVFTLKARFRKSPAPSASVAASGRWPGVRTLVVVRPDSGHEPLQHWLEEWGLRPDFVDDGFSAVQTLMRSGLRQPYRLALLDAEAPGTNTRSPKPRPLASGGAASTRALLLGPRSPGDGSQTRETRLPNPLVKEDLHRAIQRLLGPPASETRVVPLAPIAPDERRSASVIALRILVCEDDQVNAMVVEELVRRRGHHAHVVADGPEVLTSLERGDYDLLFLDLHMPGLDGFQVIEEIRAREHARGGHLPVIALTARSRDRDRERCLAAGMDGFLTKPINGDEFSAAIARFFPKAVWPERPSTTL